MPEIPELNAIAKNLEKQFKGQKVKSIEFFWSKKLNAPVPEYNEAIVNSSLTSVSRSSKELELNFSSGHVLGIHLMITGRFHLLPSTEKLVRQVFSIDFENGSGLAISDRMGLTKFTLNPIKSEIPEVLSSSFTLEFFRETLDTYTKIKSLLMDQQKIRGLGNAYIDEILYEVKISPFTHAKYIPPGKIDELYNAISDVLVRAENEIDHYPLEKLFTFENKTHRMIHDSKRTHTDDGELIHVKSQNLGRTYYTDSQILYKTKNE